MTTWKTNRSKFGYMWNQIRVCRNNGDMMAICRLRFHLPLTYKAFVILVGQLRFLGYRSACDWPIFFCIVVFPIRPSSSLSCRFFFFHFQCVCVVFFVVVGSIGGVRIAPFFFYHNWFVWCIVRDINACLIPNGLFLNNNNAAHSFFNNILLLYFDCFIACVK